MEEVIGKCANLDCSQYEREKSILVCLMYGYGQPDMSVTCPECNALLVVDRKIGTSARLRHLLRSMVPVLMSKAFE